MYFAIKKVSVQTTWGFKIQQISILVTRSVRMSPGLNPKKGLQREKKNIIFHVSVE